MRSRCYTFFPQCQFIQWNVACRLQIYTDLCFQTPTSSDLWPNFLIPSFVTRVLEWNINKSCSARTSCVMVQLRKHRWEVMMTEHVFADRSLLDDGWCQRFQRHSHWDLKPGSPDKDSFLHSCMLLLWDILQALRWEVRRLQCSWVRFSKGQREVKSSICFQCDRFIPPVYFHSNILVSQCLEK